MRESIAQVEALIQRECERGVPASRVVLAGFSQGGAIALATGVRREAPLAGIVALSTYLPMASTTPVEATVAGLRTPVFQAHGVHDPVVPASLGALSRDILRKLGAPVAWHEYPMPHSVCGEEVRDLAGWLETRFTAAP